MPLQLVLKLGAVTESDLRNPETVGTRSQGPPVFTQNQKEPRDPDSCRLPRPPLPSRALERNFQRARCACFAKMHLLALPMGAACAVEGAHPPNPTLGAPKVPRPPAGCGCSSPHKGQLQVPGEPGRWFPRGHWCLSRPPSRGRSSHPFCPSLFLFASFCLLVASLTTLTQCSSSSGALATLPGCSRQGAEHFYARQKAVFQSPFAPSWASGPPPPWFLSLFWVPLSPLPVSSAVFKGLLDRPVQGPCPPEGCSAGPSHGVQTQTT